MTRILGLDSATASCSVALRAGGSVVAHRRRELARGHAEVLIPMVRDVMEAAHAGYDALDLIAVTVGPGSFTGLRIGLSAARGLALAAGKPLFGVTTLEAVAEAVPLDERAGRLLLAVIESKREELFAQIFGENLSSRGPPIAAAPAELAGYAAAAKILVAGDAAERAALALRDAGIDVSLSSASAFPDAAAVTAIADRRWRPGEPPEPVEPLYLHPPAVRLPAGAASSRTG
jgi:tRNA threonylcarbamoyladenosine biosynthesis protein TsaB